jgi:hypothetical protein
MTSSISGQITKINFDKILDNLTLTVITSPIVAYGLGIVCGTIYTWIYRLGLIFNMSFKGTYKFYNDKIDAIIKYFKNRSF